MKRHFFKDMDGSEFFIEIDAGAIAPTIDRTIV